jgi:hypothetical protein
MNFKTVRILEKNPVADGVQIAVGFFVFYREPTPVEQKKN